ncbi:MAG: amidohydrolase family protein [Rhodanobacteraceae bacterium]|nr:amidohydrolase family protein [Rhodanobacteraceae bacterium]
MPKFLVLLFLACLPLGADARPLLLKADAYLDVQSGKLIKPAEILVDEGRIVAINREQWPDEVETVALPGKTLLPGLMDMHVHLDLDFDKANFGIVVTESGAEAALRGARNAERTLMAGFTTVRNVGQVHPSLDLIDVAVAHAAEQGWIRAPRIIAAGHMISIVGGHGDLAMAEGLAEGRLELGPEYGVVSGVDDAIKATRFQIKHGAQVIKIHATAGVMSLEASVGAQQLSNEEMVAIVSEANRHEIPVAAHAHGTEGVKAAIRAGVSSIEHGSMLDAEAIQMMVDRNVFLVPTNGLMDLIKFDLLPAQKRAKAEYVSPRMNQSLSEAIKAGVKVALGTDAPLIPHGQNAYEIVKMTERGMTPLQAIQSATIVAAELLRIDHLGQLKPGWHADIVAVDTNPLEDIKAVQSVSFVMKAGEIVKGGPG